MEDKEYVNQLKYLIETYSDPNKDYETGFVQGLFYAYNYKLHGKDYADQRLKAHSNGDKMNRNNICGCGDGNDCGC